LVWNLLAASQVNHYFGFLPDWLDRLRRGAEGFAAGYGIHFAVSAGYDEDFCCSDGEI